jgi:glycosyltransferase involved in cell wall biosynthesis
MLVGGDDRERGLGEPGSDSDREQRWPILAPPPRDLPVHPRAAPSFSVVIAAYQAADTIRDALDSLRAQTIQPKDIVVCDDGSTDEIDEAVEPYLDDIVFLRQENAGEGAAKNAGVRAASGDFVVFLDADDIFLPERLQALSEVAAARSDLDLLTTDAYLEADGKRLRRCYEQGFVFNVLDQRSAILDRNFVFGLAAVHRGRFLASGGFDSSLRYATDWDLWCRLIFDGARVGLVDVPLARYRLRPLSLSAQRAHLLRGRCAVLEKASLRVDLSEAERDVLTRALRRERRDALLAELREALVQDAP